MKKLSTSVKGFTLVELLVVISILAILAVIGLTSFAGIQRGARDARRQGEIEAIAKALEANKTPGFSTYNPLADSMFQGGATPVEPESTRKYCIAILATTVTPADPTGTWTTTCPTPYVVVAAGVPTVLSATKTWKVCALLENGPAVFGVGSYFCKSNQQ